MGRKLEVDEKVKICLVYCETGHNQQAVRRRLRHHVVTIKKALNWLKNRSRRYVAKLAREYTCPSLLTLYSELHHQDQATPSCAGMRQGFLKIRNVSASDWRGEGTNIVRRFVNLYAEAVGGEVRLQPPVLSFPGQMRPNTVLHCARTPLSQINQEPVLLREGGGVRVDVVCSEPLVNVDRAALACTSGEVCCRFSSDQPSEGGHSAGCLSAHPLCVAYPEAAYEIPQLFLKPGKYGVKVTLPYDGRTLSAFIRISSPPEERGLDAELLSDDA